MRLKKEESVRYLADLVNAGAGVSQISKEMALAVSSVDRYVREAKRLELLPEGLKINGDSFELDGQPYQSGTGLGMLDEERAARLLSRCGYIIEKPALVSDIRAKLDIKPYSGDWYRLGVVADTQFGSRYQQLTHLHKAYRIFASEGITRVLHAGDLTDGQSGYKGHEFELFCHGADAQVDYTVSHYPQEPGITTELIAGNHDELHWRKAGVDVCARIAEKRPDINYHGLHGAYLEAGGASIYLHHGAGGNSYARSYRLQKVIEQMSPDQKPNILLVGHYHTQCYLPGYRNVYAIQLPCLQSQTPYLKRRGLYPELGAVIFEFMPDGEGGILKFRAETIPFYVPKHDDY